MRTIDNIAANLSENEVLADMLQLVHTTLP